MVPHPKRGWLLYIGNHEANWLCILNANAPGEECNVECVTLQAPPPKTGSLEWASGLVAGGVGSLPSQPTILATVERDISTSKAAHAGRSAMRCT